MWQLIKLWLMRLYCFIGICIGIGVIAAVEDTVSLFDKAAILFVCTFAWLPLLVIIYLMISL